MTRQRADLLHYKGMCLRAVTQPPAPFLRDQSRMRFLSSSSRMHRGYLAQWRIADGSLFLTDLIGSVCREEASVGAPLQRCGERHQHPCAYEEIHLTDLFPEGGEVPASWFTGILKVFGGSLLIEVEAGRVTGGRMLAKLVDFIAILLRR